MTLTRHTGQSCLKAQSVVASLCRLISKVEALESARDSAAMRIMALTDDVRVVERILRAWPVEPTT